MLGALWRALSFYPLNGLVLGKAIQRQGWVGPTDPHPREQRPCQVL